jgi:periplasmic protein TonB
MLIHRVNPVYPPTAKRAHVQGTVVLHAIIGKDGKVNQLAYVSGPAMLLSATMNAVRQWKYKPFLVNGEPVEVDTIIVFTFTLGD